MVSRLCTYFFSPLKVKQVKSRLALHLQSIISLYGVENELQLWAQRELERLRIPCYVPTVAMSIYQRHMFEIGTNALVDDAKAKLEASGKLTEGMTPSMLLSAYQRLKMEDGTNALLVNAKAKLEAAGRSMEGMTLEELLSAYVCLKMEDGTNALVVNAIAKLEAAGKPTEGMTSEELIGAENSRRAKLKVEDGTLNLRNLTEKRTDKRNINNRLSNMKKALPKWYESFDEIVKEDLITSQWLRNQQKGGTQGLRSKAAFEEEHSTETEWQDNLVLLEGFMTGAHEVDF